MDADFKVADLCPTPCGNPPGTFRDAAVDENGFFRFVWRFNGVVVALMLLAAVVIAAVGGYRLLSEPDRARPARTIVNAAADSRGEPSWEFGHLLSVEGTSYVILPLETGRNRARGYSSESVGSTRNLLFIDSAGSTRRWLFPNNDYLIIDHTPLLENTGRAVNGRVSALLYTLAKSDSDGDGRLTRGDALSVALSRPDGSGYREILDGLGNLLGHARVDRDTLLLVYQKQDVTYSVTLGLKDFSLNGGGPLPKVGRQP